MKRERMETEKFQRENEEMKKQLSKSTIAPSSSSPLQVKSNNFKHS